MLTHGGKYYDSLLGEANIVATVRNSFRQFPILGIGEYFKDDSNFPPEAINLKIYTEIDLSAILSPLQ